MLFKESFKIFKQALFLIFSFQCLAIADESFVCPENNITYRGVTCCLNSVSKSTCQNIVDQLPLKILEAVTLVQRKYSQGEYAYGHVPNCFWSAAQVAGLIPEREQVPAPVQVWEITDWLKKSSMLELQAGALWQQGSLLLLEAHGEVREDIVENHIPKKKWFPFVSLEHAAVYLGSGLLFQKENMGSAVFSIDSVENTLKAYERGWNKSPQYRGQMQVRAYY